MISILLNKNLAVSSYRRQAEFRSLVSPPPQPVQNTSESFAPKDSFELSPEGEKIFRESRTEAPLFPNLDISRSYDRIQTDITAKSQGYLMDNLPEYQNLTIEVSPIGESPAESMTQSSDYTDDINGKEEMQPDIMRNPLSESEKPVVDDLSATRSATDSNSRTNEGPAWNIRSFLSRQAVNLYRTISGTAGPAHDVTSPASLSSGSFDVKF